MLKKFIFSVATPIACALSIVSTNVQAQGPCCPPPPCSEDPCCTPAWLTDALLFLGATSIGVIAGVSTGYALREHHHGDDGPQGVAGPQGDEGPKGGSGVDGFQGVQGPQGPQGVQGPSGSTGLPGVTGPTGPTGLQGLAGDTGATGITGVTGPGGAGAQALPGATSVAFGITTTFTSPDTAFPAGTYFYLTQPNGEIFESADTTTGDVTFTLTPPFYQGNYVVTLFLPTGPSGLSHSQVITVTPSVNSTPQPEVVFISDYTATTTAPHGVSVSVDVPVQLVAP